MSTEYIRYTKAPSLYISYDCSGLSCGSETVHHDGDDFVCNDCGTSWHDDGDEGQLYADWSGEDLTGPEVDPDEWLAHQKAVEAQP